MTIHFYIPDLMLLALAMLLSVHWDAGLLLQGLWTAVLGAFFGCVWGSLEFTLWRTAVSKLRCAVVAALGGILMFLAGLVVGFEAFDLGDEFYRLSSRGRTVGAGAERERQVLTYAVIVASACGLVLDRCLRR